MDKAITTTLLIVISVLMTVMLFNAAYPAVLQSSDAINSMVSRTDERLRTQINVIHAAGELDSSGFWQDSNYNSLFEVSLWVKNTGTTRILPLENLDVFFGVEGNFTRIPHESEAGGIYPYWVAELENASDWSPTATLRITLRYQAPLSSGRYFIRIITPSGISDDFLLGM